MPGIAGFRVPGSYCSYYKASSSPQIASSLVYSSLLDISACFDQVLGGSDTHSQVPGGSDTHSQASSFPQFALHLDYPFLLDISAYLAWVLSTASIKPADAQPLLRQGSAGSKPLTRLQPDRNPTARNPTPGDVGYPVPGLSGTGVSGSRVGLAPRPPDLTRAKH
ncbi:hypothetical protein EV361DRAFT_1037643 [Lentinula raphanica]|nr:hypothetical protein EV361DRAFT_1037643 [Lentinula raphanica]